MNTIDANDVLTGTITGTYKELKLSDRCDRCGDTSQAFVRIVKVIENKEEELFFCGHHFAKHEPTLVAEGWLVQDERNKINAKPMSGAPEGALDSED